MTFYRGAGALVIVALGLALATAGPAAANPSNDITVNPLGFIGWGPDIEYERAITSGMALALHAKVGGWSLGDWTNNTVGGGISWRFYLQKENQAPKGLWIGPGFETVRVSSKLRESDVTSNILHSGYAELGYRWLFGEEVAFTLAPFIKLGYNYGKVTVLNETLDFTGLLFGTGLAVGVAF